MYNPRKSAEAPYGPVSIYKYAEKGIVSPLYLCFRALHPINAEFFDFYFKSPAWHRYIYLAGDSGARHDRVSIRDDVFFAMPIRLPSEAEQYKISSLLSLIENKIKAQTALVENLKKYKRGVSRAIFTQKIRLLPNGGDWRQTVVGNICDIVMGQSPDSDSYNADGVGVPLVQGNADMCNGVTSPKRFTNKPTKICEEGSIILSVRAPVGAVGRADRQICIGRGVCAINAENNDYLYHFLASNESYWKHIEQGGTFTAISGDDIASMPILYPSIKEREKISNFLNLIDVEIRVAETMEIALLMLKNSLLKNLFI